MCFEYSRRSLFTLLAVACLLVPVHAHCSFGQTSTATLTGTVQDSTGAILPDVTVSVTSTERNTSLSTRTNEVGSYVLPALSPGNYSITAELPGFKRAVREGVVLQVNQVGRIDAKYEVLVPGDSDSPAFLHRIHREAIAQSRQVVKSGLVGTLQIDKWSYGNCGGRNCLLNRLSRFRGKI